MLAIITTILDNAMIDFISGMGTNFLLGITAPLADDNRLKSDVTARTGCCFPYSNKSNQQNRGGEQEYPFLK